MEKLDLKKSLPDYFNATTGKFTIIKLPKFNYFMVDGKGDPNTAPAFSEAMQLLYGVSYTLKFSCKKELEVDYVVPPLEALWWSKDMKNFEAGKKEKWLWTMMIMIPNGISKSFATKAIQAFNVKKPESNIDLLRIEPLTEGFCLQTLHLGPYDAEGPILSELHKEYMPENGFVFNGKHHEIYLSDPRKSAPAKLKTILRQPVKKLK